MPENLALRRADGAAVLAFGFRGCQAKGKTA